MKKIFTIAIGITAIMSAKSQQLWHVASGATEVQKTSKKIHKYFTLDKAAMKSLLSHSKAASRNASAVTIELPLLDGKVERFNVFSRPVAEKSLEEKYDLHSYVAVGANDPGKYARFSFSNGVFNGMIISGNEYTFIDPLGKDTDTYTIAEKTNKTDNGRAFICSTDESVLSKEDIDRLYSQNKNIFSKNAAVAARSSDQKYRTLRLALSVTGEYTKYFGGTVAGALTAMNATMTRVNGVMERDLGLHLNMIDKPEIIFTNATTDPYSDAATGAKGAWNLELQKTLTSVVGEANYDIGHLFGASGGGGNAGCIGCVCVSPPLDDNGVPTGKEKGSGFTSPADGIPTGDNFDIDYVAHEMGHQVGGNHTFSFQLEDGSSAQQEPGSGSTIMGYAGITGTDNDVQAHSDAYYHYYSIQQIQAVLSNATCDVETSISNTPPTVAPLPAYIIPKSTAFVLTANASDADGDALNYTWEQADNASVTINKLNLGTTSNGADFRSIAGTSSPTRYFPAFSTVLNGSVSDPASWESTSSVARTTNFSVTVRDNNPAGSQNTTENELITVGNDGPFAFINIPGTKVYTNAAQTIVWNVANTNAEPYNSPNVKLDYTTDNGATWTVIAESTPNDGTEAVNLPADAVGKTVKFRASSIGNVFYTISKAYTVASNPQACDGTAPANIAIQNLALNSATATWDIVDGATYIVNYRAVGTSAWTSVTTTTNSVNLNTLKEDTKYELQVAAVCSGTTGSFSSSVNFTTPSSITYCTVVAPSSADEFISNVTVAGQSMDSQASGYADYTGTAEKLITLQQGSTGNTISVAKSWTNSKYKDGIAVWIDFNRNGTFETSEKILSSAASTTTPITGTFNVPATVDPNSAVRMRVVLRYNATPTNACTAFSYGEVEDYRVAFTPNAILSTLEANAAKITFFPNPVTDVLNISKVSDRATYAIYNMAGQMVASGNVTGNKVSVSKLPKGVYVINVENNGEKATSKFIKE